MKINSTMLVVTDMKKSVEFYKQVLGLKITADFGENKTLTGGLALQTVGSYKKFMEQVANQVIFYLLSAAIILNFISKRTISISLLPV